MCTCISVIDYCSAPHQYPPDMRSVSANVKPMKRALAGAQRGTEELIETIGAPPGG